MILSQSFDGTGTGKFVSPRHSLVLNVDIRLNSSWRVIDDPPQWTLQKRKGNPTAKSSGWVSAKFIRNRDHLLERIAEICGDVDPDAIATIMSWPTGYVQWKLSELQQSASPSAAPPVVAPKIRDTVDAIK